MTSSRSKPPFDYAAVTVGGLLLGSVEWTFEILLGVVSLLLPLIPILGCLYGLVRFVKWAAVN